MISIGTRSPSHIVGLDIEPGYIAAAEVETHGKLRLTRAASAPLESGVVRDGEVTDVEALADALRALFAARKLPHRVRVGVVNQRVIVRTIDLPPIEDPKELDAAIRFQASDYIPMPLEQAVLEYQALGIHETEQGRRMRVVLVAARRDMVMRLVSAVRMAGLRPEGVDLSAFALVRALYHETLTPGAASMLIHVGGLTNLAVASNGTCLFARALPGGLEAMVEALAERRGLTLTHARQWLGHVGLSGPVEGVEGDPGIVGEARRVLLDGVRLLADEVRNSLDYYRTQVEGDEVETTLLSGPAAAISGFVEQLSGELGMPVRVAAVERARAEVDVDGPLGDFTVAAGLAVAEHAA